MAGTNSGSTPLSSPQRVRDRLGPEAADLTDAFLEQLIAEQQAFVEATAGHAFAPSDAGFALACSATTNLAAAVALLALRSSLDEAAEYRIGKLQVSKGTQRRAWASLVEELRATGQEALRGAPVHGPGGGRVSGVAVVVRSGEPQRADVSLASAHWTLRDGRSLGPPPAAACGPRGGSARRTTARR